MTEPQQAAASAGVGPTPDDVLATADALAPAAPPFADLIAALDQRRPNYWLDIYGAIERPFLANDDSGALGAATIALETYIRNASDAPPHEYENGANQLCRYAFAPKDGPLTQHLSGSQAMGITQMMQGIFSIVRNPVHHSFTPGVPFTEVVQALDAVNWAFAMVRRLAAEAYLNSYLSSTEYRFLLSVRHCDIDGDGEAERVVTYARGLADGSSRGSILVTKKSSGGVWSVVPGRLSAMHCSLDGAITPGLTSTSGAPVTKVRFSQFVPGYGYIHEAVLFELVDGKLTALNLPEHARFSWFAHEVRDHLQLGHPQLITYHNNSRHYWVPNGENVEPVGEPEHSMRVTPDAAAGVPQVRQPS